MEMNVERISIIIDWLESGAIHVTDEGKTYGFDMGYWDVGVKEPDYVGRDNPEFNKGECGSAMCIGGATEKFFGEEVTGEVEKAALLLGVNIDVARDLFYPWFASWYKSSGKKAMTPSYMAGVLRRLIETGKLVG